MNVKIYLALVVLGLMASVNVNGSTASMYIADKGYLEYRLELVEVLMEDPEISDRLKEAQSSEEFLEILMGEREKRLKKYREENGLDDNGAKKE